MKATNPQNCRLHKIIAQSWEMSCEVHRGQSIHTSKLHVASKSLVHKLMFLKKWMSEFGVEELKWLHKALTSN